MSPSESEVKGSLMSYGRFHFPINGVIWIISIYFGLNTAKAQNLIPNSSFELYDSLPCNFIQYSAEFGLYLHNWYLPTGGTSDIISTQIPTSCNYGNPSSFNSCGLQFPHTGNNMVGLVAQSFSNYQEYIQVELDSVLIPGQRYFFECYALLGNCSNFYSNNLGACVSVNAILDTASISFINRIPCVLDTLLISDVSTWTQISGCFQSDSAYKYLTIGHFQNSCDQSGLHTGAWPHAYYYIDDVSLSMSDSCSESNAPCSLLNLKEESTSLNWRIQDEVLFIRSDLSRFSIQIISLYGETIYTGNFNSGIASIQVKNFEPNIYLAVMRSEHSSSKATFKFIKY